MGGLYRILVLTIFFIIENWIYSLRFLRGFNGYLG